MNETLALPSRYSAEGWEALTADPFWAAVLLVAVIAAVAAASVTAWRERRATRAGVWLWILALRLVALAAIAVGIVGVQRRPATERTDDSRVVVLVDRSASMALPAGEAAPGSTRSAAAVGCLADLVAALESTHVVRVGAFGETLDYTSDVRSEDRFNPIAKATRVGDALRRVAIDGVGGPLAGVVLLTDGRSTAGPDAASEAGALGKPVHVVGFGRSIESPTVDLVDVSVPRRVFVGDPFRVTARLVGRGAYSGAVRTSLRLVDSTAAAAVVAEPEDVVLPLADESPSAVAEYDVEAPVAGSYLAVVTADVGGRPLTRRVRVDAVERQTRVLLVAGGPTRDYRFLRDHLYRDATFTTDVLLQSAVGGVSQDASTLLEAFPTPPEQLDEYDAVVVFDADWDSLAPNAASSLERWVGRGGGGVLFVAGASQTLAIAAADPRSPLARLSPVAFDSEPLSVSLATAAPTEPAIVRLTPVGRSSDFMRVDPAAADPTVAWRDIGGLYAEPPLAKAKPGGTLYARLGEGDASPPLLAEQFYGAGRVAYLATGQVWRLRREDPNRFGRFYTKLLRHLSQGRLLGSAGRGRLTLDRERYEVGERLRVRLLLKDTPPSRPSVRWRSPNAAVTEVLADAVEGQPLSYTSEFLAQEAGPHSVSYALPAGRPLTAEARVVLPERELRERTRDETALRAIAEASAGTYYESIAEALATTGPGSTAILDATPSRAETTVELGPPDAAFGEAVGRGLLLLATAALLGEWTLRRLCRLA